MRSWRGAIDRPPFERERAVIRTFRCRPAGFGGKFPYQVARRGGVGKTLSSIQEPARRRVGPDVLKIKSTITETMLLAMGYAAWLASYPLLIFLLPNDVLAGGLGLCLGLGVNMLHILLRPQDIPTTPAVWLYIGLFGMVIFISQLIGNLDNASLTSLIQCGAMIAIMFIAACIAHPALFERTLRFYAWFIAGVLLIVIADGDYVWGRLVGRGQPNFWGMMALSGALASLSLNRMFVKAVPLLVALVMLYLTNSRGSTIGTFTGLMTASAVYFLINGARKRLVIITVLSIAVVVGAAAEITSGFISDQVLNLNDPRRGLDSGFTGRLGPWLYGLDLALERPFFGYGYRASETLFEPIGIDSVHNGYLSMLLDMGVTGLIAWLVFLMHVIWTGFQRMRRPVAIPAIGILVGYAILGLVERYALNAGQPLSILFLISAFYMLRPFRRTAISRYGQPRPAPLAPSAR
jgi:O-antigen ligase